MKEFLQQHVNPTTAAIVMLFTLPVLAFIVMGILKLIYLYLKKKEELEDSAASASSATQRPQ